MSIAKLMIANVVSVDVDAPLSSIKGIFERERFHHLLVTENTVLVGVVSDRDLLKSISPNVDSAAATTKDLASLNKRAHQIMCRKLVTLTKEASIADAIHVFNEKSVSCIPIISERGVPIGIITWRDVMRELGQRLQALPQ